MVSLRENQVHRWARSGRVARHDPDLPARSLALYERSTGHFLHLHAYCVFPFMLFVTVLVLYLARQDIVWCAGAQQKIA